MEKEIELLKKQYLATFTPMTESEGYSDILCRLEKKPVIKFAYTRYFAFGTVLVILIVCASLLIFPNSNATSAVKALGQQVVNNILKPTITPLPQPAVTTIKSKPTSTPVPTQKVTETPSKPKPTKAQEINNSGKKNTDNPTTQDEEVKGINSEKERNENAASNNRYNNPSEEKSQSKRKN